MNHRLITEVALLIVKVECLEAKLRSLVFDSDEYCEVAGHRDHLDEIIDSSSAYLSEREWLRAKEDAIEFRAR